jgi:transcriptional regulator with XRE-family HTH domain
MPQRPSPYPPAQVARQALANRLREVREDAGLTAIALAAAAGWDRTLVSKIEHGVRAATPRLVRTWCRVCDADDQAEDLLAQLRVAEGAYVEWKRIQRAGLRRLQHNKVPLYEQTGHLRVYASQVIPGLVQTRGYATALLTSITERFETPNDVAQAVDIRLDRQRVMGEPGHRFTFVLEEAVLYYGHGGKSAMDVQLARLLEMMMFRSVTLLIIPMSADRARQWALETFVLYDADRVDVELLSAEVAVTTPTEVARYVGAFADLEAMAVGGDEARTLIERASASLR